MSIRYWKIKFQIASSLEFRTQPIVARISLINGIDFPLVKILQLKTGRFKYPVQHQLLLCLGLQVTLHTVTMWQPRRNFTHLHIPSHTVLAHFVRRSIYHDLALQPIILCTTDLFTIRLRRIRCIRRKFRLMKRSRPGRQTSRDD